MTSRKVFVLILVLLAFIVCVWIAKDLLATFWSSLSSGKQDAIVSGVTGLLVGVLSSMVASYLFSRVQKEVWQTDIGALTAQLSNLKDQLTDMSREHQQLLRDLVPAIGGSFTQSLFSFHPMASKEIARILSEETDRLYGRHHKRVIVTTAKDMYTIKDLQRFDPQTMVWSLEFHIRWKWLNDSRIAKHPLEDFLLVAVANDEALDDFSPEHESEAHKVAQRARLSDFLEKNLVKSTVVNPLDAWKRIPANRINEVFAVDKVYVSDDKQTFTVDESRLRRIPDAELPIGVYAAWALPPDLNLPLTVGARLDVEYIGHMCLLAAAVEDADNKLIYRGHMTFRPSDVVGDQYELTLSYPPSVTIDGKAVRLSVEKENSGCQFVHGPLVNHPQDRTDAKGARWAEMAVPGPLTDLHQLSLIWHGEVQ